MADRIADRLVRVRERQIVGRQAELSLFTMALEAVELPFLLLHVSGPNGIGKTTLLRVFQSYAETHGFSVVALDIRASEGSPEGLLHLLRASLGLETGQDPLTFLGESETRRVLLLDNYEDFEPYDDWMREVCLPQLSAETLVVRASVNPLALAWRTDPGWQLMARALPLRNLSPEASLSYLANRGVPVAYHQAALDFTHGYPLALALIADMAAQLRPDSNVAEFLPESAPHIIQALLDQFVEKTPTPAHRAAVEVAAVARLTTEPLLATLLAGQEGMESEEAARNAAPEIFHWLRGLSFMEYTAAGLAPHETARETLLADLRWRNRERYNHLHRRARAYYGSRLEAGQGIEQQRYLFDYMFLHRDNPMVRSAFDWKENAAIRTDGLRHADIEPILSMVRRYEGDISAELAAHWLKLQPESVVVFRDRAAGTEAEPLGFLMQLALDRTTPEERSPDPALLAAWEFLRTSGPLRAGETATHFRFWMARDTYHGISPVQSRIIVQVVRHFLTTRGLAYSFFPVGNPERWLPMFQYAEIQRLDAADFSVDGRSYGIFGNDWRRLPATAWLDRMAEKEVVPTGGPNSALTAASPPPAPLVVLSEEDFINAVRDALRHLNEPDQLRDNPLTRSRLVADAGGTESASATLRKQLMMAINSLQTLPRLSRCYKPLYHTYVQPAPSQERAAELLDLPFSTYRRHLTEGVGKVAQYLWQREVGDAAPEKKETAEGDPA